ncbi:MAG: hypothetical protein IT324_05040 [Anaerolineae bacterium]|nr:hypothetical protein [Anaerolineae bacterium]
MNGIVRVVVIAVALILVSTCHRTVLAQTQPANTGSICVLAFNDTSEIKGSRDSGEGLLTAINVNLMVNQNVIIANHITDGKEPFCFTDLSPQQYTVSFSSPLYQATTSTTFTFALGPGERASREFGAVSLAAATPEASLPTEGINIDMTRGTRLGLSAASALLAMLFTIGIGMIIYSVFLVPRRRHAPRQDKPDNRT